jgi:PatG C-terminal/Family of unknown function (DUF5838)
MIAAELDKERLKEQRIQFIRAHQQAFDVDPIYPLHLFEDFVVSICRMDSDCWDVQLKFFDPENSRRAKKVFRFTIDVSDLIPVTLGEVRSWSSPY